MPLGLVPGSTLTQFGLDGTNYCGPGYANGQFGGKADPNGPITGPVDGVCRDHDVSYDKLANSPTPAADRLAADLKLLNDIGDLVKGGGLSGTEAAQAAAIAAAFIPKVVAYDIPAAVVEAAEGLLKQIFDTFGPDPIEVTPPPEGGLLIPYDDDGGGGGGSGGGGDGSDGGEDDSAVSPTLGTTPDPLTKTRKYVDPLILDLGGDGIEIAPLSKGILFDANGDGIKTGTAWAGAGDGLLVWDRNGNGTIDSGRELFGDETLLANGQKATDGFAALRELDGNADWVFDSKDAQYANLRVWRDLNQDGVSQATELKTLADSGVQSINLASKDAFLNQGDAILAKSGSFTRTDGSTGQAGSYILSQNNFLRSFPPVTVSTAALALPDIKGSGWVRDLREAATVSPELLAFYNAAKDTPTRAGYKQGVADLMRAWGNDSDYQNASKQALAENYGLVLSDPLDNQERGWMDKAIKASQADRNAYRATLTPADLAKFDAMRERMVGGLERLYAYEAFTGYTFLNWQQVRGDAINYTPRTTGGTGRVAVEVWVPFSQIILENRNAVLSTQTGYIRVTIPAPVSGGTAHLDVLWNRLVDDAANNLMPPLRLGRLLNMIDVSITANGFAFDFARLNTGLVMALTGNSSEGASLFIDLYRAYGSTLNRLGWNGAEQLRTLMQRATTDVAIRNAFAETGLTVLDSGLSAGRCEDRAVRSTGNDIVIGNAGRRPSRRASVSECKAGETYDFRSIVWHNRSRYTSCHIERAGASAHTRARRQYPGITERRTTQSRIEAGNDIPWGIAA